MSNSKQAITDLFLAAWNELPTINFDPSWKNGTGYLDHVTMTDLGLSEGQFVRTTTDDNRKAIIKCLAPGLNQVVFERGVNGVFVSNEPNPSKLKTLGCFSSSWSYNTMEAFLGKRDFTVTFNPEYIVEAFREEGIPLDPEVEAKILTETPFTLQELEELALDPYSCLVYMNVKRYND